MNRCLLAGHRVASRPSVLRACVSTSTRRTCRSYLRGKLSVSQSRPHKKRHLSSMTDSKDSRPSALEYAPADRLVKFSKPSVWHTFSPLAAQCKVSSCESVFLCEACCREVMRCHCTTGCKLGPGVSRYPCPGSCKVALSDTFD